MGLTKRQKEILGMSNLQEGSEYDVNEEASRGIIGAAITEIQSEMDDLVNRVARLPQDASTFPRREGRVNAEIRKSRDRIKALGEKIEGEIEVY